VNISDAGLKFIQHEEGFVGHAYLDKKAKPNVWTIGYGETQLDSRPVREGDLMTIEQAAMRLRQRCDQHFGASVRATLGAQACSELKQHQFDALVSLAYNIGTGGFANSTVARLLRAGDTSGASAAFLMWDKAGGKVDPVLHARRPRERKLFDTGAYA
jgi:lysozyme